MDRRSFLRNIGMLVGGVMLGQAIPLGRVWSFPKDIRIAKTILTYDDITAATLRYLNAHGIDNYFKIGPTFESLKSPFIYENMDEECGDVRGVLSH